MQFGNVRIFLFNLLDYTNLFSPNDYKKNDTINTKIFSRTKSMEILYCVIFGKCN